VIEDDTTEGEGKEKEVIARSLCEKRRRKEDKNNTNICSSAGTKKHCVLIKKK
jgi:hypothetical protein